MLGRIPAHKYLFEGLSFSESLNMCVGAAAWPPGAVPAVCGKAAGGVSSAQEGHDPGSGETLAPQRTRQDAAHLRPSHARRDR